MNVGKVICTIVGATAYLGGSLYINHMYQLSTGDFVFLLVCMGVLAMANYTEGLFFTNRG